MNGKRLYLIISLVLTASLSACNQPGSQNQVGTDVSPSAKSTASPSAENAKPGEEAQTDAATTNQTGTTAKSGTKSNTSTSNKSSSSNKFTVPVKATEANRSPSEVNTTEAEQRESHWICGMVGEEWANVTYFETQNHFINICKKKNSPSSLLYVEESKSGGPMISVPASVSAEGKYYTAEDVKTDTTYIVAVDESGTTYSTVNKLHGTQGDSTDVEEIRNEPIVKMKSFSGGQ